MFFLLALCTKSIYILNSGSTQGYTRESTEPKNPKQSAIFKKRLYCLFALKSLYSNVFEWSCLKGSCSRVKKILQQILVFGPGPLNITFGSDMPIITLLHLMITSKIYVVMW